VGHAWLRVPALTSPSLTPPDTEHVDKSYPASGDDEMTSSVHDDNSSRNNSSDHRTQASPLNDDLGSGDDILSHELQDEHYDKKYRIVGPLICMSFSTVDASDAGFSVDLLFRYPDYLKVSSALFCFVAYSHMDVGPAVSALQCADTRHSAVG